MGYLAIARKWRPSKFEDLVGQGHVVQTLKNAILLNRVSHAYLFSGARGVGKTSVARIFAKALRCPNAKDAIPCNTCPECVAISESRSVDVVEFDGASNNGVEAVRGIRDNVAYSASSGFYKVYIIDEVHMLSISAFNALLKTLEEPPKHVIFIFATTEVQKIPVTVLSRCQRFEFRRLTQAQITQCLAGILSAENVAIEEGALAVIAAHADGSLRDAQSLLDTAMSYASGSGGAATSLTEKQVVEALGVSETSAVSQFLGAILEKDLGAILRIIDENYRAGVDLRHFSERCLEELRLLYLAVLAKESRDTLTPESLDVSATRFTHLQELAKDVPLVQLERMAQIFSKAISQLAWSSLPRFVLEMAAVRMTKLSDLARIELALRDLPPSGKETPPEAPARAPDRREPGPKPTASAAPLHAAPAPSAPPRPKLVVPPPPSPRAPAPPPSDDEPPHSADDMEPPDFEQPPTDLGPGRDGYAPPGDSTTSWKAFVDAAMKKRPMLGALLSHANFRLDNGPGGKSVHVSFASGSFYERQAADPKSRDEIESLVKSFFGKETKLSLSTPEGVPMNISIEQTKQAEAAQLRKEALEHPAVGQMKEVLGAEVVDVNVEV